MADVAGLFLCGWENSRGPVPRAELQVVIPFPARGPAPGEGAVAIGWLCSTGTLQGGDAAGGPPALGVRVTASASEVGQFLHSAGIQGASSVDP